MPPPEPPITQFAEALRVLPDYESIGQFYRELARGIDEAAKTDPGLFEHGDPARQFRGADFFDSAMTLVRDVPSAHVALETIVDQGEGSIGVPDSHYAIFVELYQRRKEWTCVNYIDEPSTDKYVDKPVAYHVSIFRLCCVGGG